MSIVLGLFVYFNPRSREGSDNGGATSPATPLISIHAPVKGATGVPYLDGEELVISIHAPVKGATWPF